MVSISVVMPTYNTEVSILKEAVDSILCQTFKDFEFIIIDDGSTNESVDYLQSLQDKRIKLIRNPENLGITKSLIIGFREAKGKYIARMDSDDISFPKRFEKQFAFMEAHPDVILCGSNVEYFDASFSRKSTDRIKDMETYRISTLFLTPGPRHPTAFLNRELLIRYHISYDENLPYSQDYALWVEISKHGKIRVLRDVLLRYRTYSSRVSISHREEQIRCHKVTEKKLLQQLLGTVTDAELDFHHHYCSGNFRDISINADVMRWIHRLIHANHCAGVYNQMKFVCFTYDKVVKKIIYLSFNHRMTYMSKIGMFFRYLPFPFALKASMGMCGRSILSLVRGQATT